MYWVAEWRRVSRGIEEFVAAGDVYFRTGPGCKADASGRISGSFVLTANRLVDSLRVLVQDEALSSAAKTVLVDFLRTWTPMYVQGGWDGLQFMMGSLACLRASMDVLVEDRPAQVRGLVRRAMLHLQRSVVADSRTRDSWQTAFKSGERAVERLGATHFLLHGIWAFKADSPEEKTDLVLGTRFVLTPDIQAATEGLVLTEWKLVRDEALLSEAAEAGFRQARRYGKSVLAGFEVASERFVILVSKKTLEIPQPRIEDEITYTFWNVAVDPERPSDT